MFIINEFISILVCALLYAGRAQVYIIMQMSSVNLNHMLPGNRHTIRL